MLLIFFKKEVCTIPFMNYSPKSRSCSSWRSPLPMSSLSTSAKKPAGIVAVTPSPDWGPAPSKPGCVRPWYGILTPRVVENKKQDGLPAQYPVKWTESWELGMVWRLRRWWGHRGRGLEFNLFSGHLIGSSMPLTQSGRIWWLGRTDCESWWPFSFFF